MSKIIEFAGENINPCEVSSIGGVYKSSDGKYYFNIWLSGKVVKSSTYKTEALAENGIEELEIEVNNGNSHDCQTGEESFVESVNGKVGEVVLNQDDIGNGSTYKQYSLTEKNKLSGIANGAEVNNISDTNATDLTDGGDTTLHTHDNKQNKLSIRTESSSFSLSASDTDKYIRYTGAGNITVAVPNTFAINDVITIRQADDGNITLEADSDETLNGELKSAGIHSTLQIIKIADKTYDIIGGVSY